VATEFNVKLKARSLFHDGARGVKQAMRLVPEVVTKMRPSEAPPEEVERLLNPPSRSLLFRMRLLGWALKAKALFFVTLIRLLPGGVEALKQDRALRRGGALEPRRTRGDAQRR
jgi:hypothetical protein